MRKLLFILFVFSLLAVNLNSAWFDNILSRVTQPDGTPVEVFLTGDEYHNWAHDEDGYTIIQDDATGFW
ncbi:MAG: hypothetical protein FWG20_03515, partial [Candidatus Cloacimonetes bacterium]|nr:hypothetical protein [Candidatus Cloacimonadota bacterium]